MRTTIDRGARRRQPHRNGPPRHVGLLLLFAVQHSGMARAGFKQWLTRYVPRPVERSTYVLVATVCLAVLMGFWRPITTTLWNIGAQPWRGRLDGKKIAFLVRRRASSKSS